MMDGSFNRLEFFQDPQKVEKLTKNVLWASMKVLLMGMAHQRGNITVF